jgi:hypothetical protein
MKRFCNNCEYLSDKYHELDPLGDWKWCELHEKDVCEDDEVCSDWRKYELFWPEDLGGEGIS